MAIINVFTFTERESTLVVRIWRLRQILTTKVDPRAVRVKSHLLRMKWVFKHQDLQMFGLKLANTGIFHPLDVVGRGSETQRQVGENLNYSIWRFNG